MVKQHQAFGLLTLEGQYFRNKLALPPELSANEERKVTYSMFAFTDKATLISYCFRKKTTVLLVSTMHKDTVPSTWEDKKSQIILHYNMTKGVNNLDKVTATVFFLFIDPKENACIFFNTTANKRKSFILSVIDKSNVYSNFVSISEILR